MSRRILGRTFRSLADVYAAVPAVACTGRCAAHCVNVNGSRAEARRTQQANGGRRVLALVSRPNSDPCPALQADGRCGVYGSRPTICRLFGVVEGLRCPYGCEAEHVLTDPEAHHLMREALRLGGRMVT